MPDHDDIDKERLGKIVALAKRGEGGERTNAERMVRRLCDKHGLNFDDVMHGIEVQEHRLEYRRGDEDLAAYVFWKYGAMTREDALHVKVSRRGHYLIVRTTLDRFLETLNAYGVLSRHYRIEKKRAADSFDDAFRMKHKLYYEPKAGEPTKNDDREKTLEELEDELKRGLLAGAMAARMDDAKIHKTLGTGKK